MVVHWHLTFYGEVKFASLWICMGKNVENFKWLLLWSNIVQISFRASLGLGNERLLKWLRAMTKMAAIPIYGKKKPRNLLLQNWGCLVAESLHKSSGTGSLPKLLKWWLYIDIWPFYGEVVCFPIHLYGKNVENFKLLLSLWVSVAQILFGASLGQGNERLLK